MEGGVAGWRGSVSWGKRLTIAQSVLFSYQFLLISFENSSLSLSPYLLYLSEILWLFRNRLNWDPRLKFAWENDITGRAL